jgi:rsbT co-antagonist protein RsbR
MFTTAIAICVLISATALAAFVAARSWEYRPSRIFVLLAAAIVCVLAATVLRDVAPTAEAAYPALVALVIGVSLYLNLLMGLLSALFVPQWFRGRWPIVWITLPYMLITLLLSIDLVGRLGFVARGVQAGEVYRLQYVQPAAGVLLGLSFLGQVVILVMLACAFFDARQRQHRVPIALLGAALLFSLLFSSFAGQLSTIARVATLVQTLPVLAVLAYAILGTRLFRPTRAALDVALQAMREAVAVADEAGVVTFVNPSAAALGVAAGRPLTEQIGAGSALGQLIGGDGGDIGVAHGERQLELAIAPVLDDGGVRRGTLLLGRDVTEEAQRSAQLERERQRLAAAVEQLEAAQRQRESLAEEVRSLSLPLIPVLPGVLILPLVGDFAGERIDEFIGVLLEGIEQQRASTVLIDITGLSLLDTHGAHGLLRGVRAATLLGARCVLVGVRPEVAQSLVSLGLPLGEIATAATLEQAVLARISPPRRAAPVPA